MSYARVIDKALALGLEALRKYLSKAIDKKFDAYDIEIEWMDRNVTITPKDGIVVYNEFLKKTLDRFEDAVSFSENKIKIVFGDQLVLSHCFELSDRAMFCREDGEIYLVTIDKDGTPSTVGDWKTFMFSIEELGCLWSTTKEIYSGYLSAEQPPEGVTVDANI